MIRIAGTALVALAGFLLGGVLNALVDSWTEREYPGTKPEVCRKSGESRSQTRSVRFALRRRCLQSGAHRLRYPLVALAVAATSAVATWQSLPALYLPGWEEISIFDAVMFGAVKMILCWLLIGLAVMDAEHRWLPDWFTLGGAALGLVFSLGRFAVYSLWSFIPLHWSLETHFGSRNEHLFDTVVRWIVGIFALPAIVLFLRWSYRRIRKQEGVQAGDAKLMLMLAAWLGLSHTLLAFVTGVLLAAVAVLAVAARKGLQTAWITRMPLASFLCAGGILSALWGGELIDAYLRWCGLA